MTTRYRVEYALKAHRRDEFIEWIKELLSVPFVISTGGLLDGGRQKCANEVQRRYAEIFRDIEYLIDGQTQDQASVGRLKMLVPSIGLFFTNLPLERAFLIQDEKRSMSMRMFVSPSFNDVRLILNTAQAISLSRKDERVQLVTFDGDVTLYQDGASLGPSDPIIGRLVKLMEKGIAVAIVTAAGYKDQDGHHYYRRLGGLIQAVADSENLSADQKKNLIIMGGESNYMFQLDTDPVFNPTHLKYIEPSEWALPETKIWSDDAKTKLLDTAQGVLEECLYSMNLPAHIIRKDHGVGLVPKPGRHMCREELEEVVLSAQRTLMVSDAVDHSIKFCAFNGGSDVWVDVGDKHLGVLSIRNYLGKIPSHRTLHVGDQFASVISNDYKARMAACTVWIASPSETVEIIDDLIRFTSSDDN